ncbi:HNH endonuclease signature motif containing protein [Pseudonocardia phyllosphaerae]|uniref:HNH endonuclease signature motif containing protein n=1 Tax=Pseudonocardia phyllosphaerae TaxID=3390502 RepID=UPI00397E9037
MGQWWNRSDEDLLAALPAAQERLNLLQAEMYEVIDEIAARGLAEPAGFRDTTDLLRGAQNVTRAVARNRVRAAEDLTPERALSGGAVEPRLPVLAAAVREGAVSAEHVRVIQAQLAAIPPHLEAEHRRPLEETLTGYARVVDPDEVAQMGKRAIALLDPDGPRPREPPPTHNRLTLRPLGDGTELRGWLDPESAAVLRSALSPLTAPVPPVPGPDGTPTPPGLYNSDAARDERSVAERNGDGLVEIARRMLATDALGVEAGESVRLVVTSSLETLQQRTGAAELSFGDGKLSAAVDAETALRLACDARVVPIVLATTGEPLFAGREIRLANRAQRRALAHRDGGCAFPGCDAPPQWCIAHHVRHWIDDGPTDVDNLVLLCSWHHRVIHHSEWEITMEGGFPLFHPPEWLPGGPRRNPLHQRIPEPRPPVPV